MMSWLKFRIIPLRRQFLQRVCDCAGTCATGHVSSDNRISCLFWCLLLETDIFLVVPQLTPV